MKLDSKFFDSIRIAPRRASEEQEKSAELSGPACQWKGCGKKGPHRAPKGRGRDGEYYQFCIDHVRQYNASYNYFNGMSDAEVTDFQKDAMTGHRPTWKVGANAWANRAEENVTQRPARSRPSARTAGAGKFFVWRSGRMQEEAPVRRRTLKPIEKKSLEVLHLGEAASAEEIKARFKELVKQHHPDANGGDTRSEEKLREIIQAYNYLKQSGLV